MGNPAVAKHGKVVMHGLDRAVQNLDDIKNAYTALSVMHSEKLHVDPDNFRVSITQKQKKRTTKRNSILN